MLSIIQNIPNIEENPLFYLFNTMNLQHKPNTLWLEFGVYKGETINFIASHTQDKVYGFDSFYGLPEMWRDGYEIGKFSLNGEMPTEINSNVELVQGMIENTLPEFLKTHNQKISCIHVDVTLYSSTKAILDNVKNYLDTDCIIIFNELVNYPGFDGETGELRAFYEFITENNVNYDWLGMYGNIEMNNYGYNHEIVAVIIHSVN
jgi:hypothetical protein